MKWQDLTELAPLTEQQLSDFEAACAAQSVRVPVSLLIGSDQQVTDFKAILGRIFTCSPFVARTFVKDPGQALALIQAWQTPVSEDVLAFDPSSSDLDAVNFMAQLRIARQWAMARIACRDLLGWADLDETLAALSRLADQAIQCAYARAWQEGIAKQGVPQSENGEAQSMVILGMGKLGGGELNYSSDIDLIFAYPETGQTCATPDQRSLDNQTFFVQLSQRLIRYLNETTADGFVFRVDMRLRPWGEAGPLVMHFDALESYYQLHGRDWERYAMIKARPITGTAAHQQALHILLRPFVYRRYLDYGAFAALREMKDMIMREVARKGLEDNVKLGAGGIREVEFTGQAFQLIRGGREPALQVRSIQKVIGVLLANQSLTTTDAEQLLNAYVFLRHTENRLQMVNDQQVHSLPLKSVEKTRLYYAMNFSTWEEFLLQLNQHRENVHTIFTRVVLGADHGASTSASPSVDTITTHWLDLADGRMQHEHALNALSHAGFINPADIYQRLRDLVTSRVVLGMSAIARERFERVLPAMINVATQSTAPDITLLRLLQLLQAVAQRSVYMSLLLEYPQALQQLARLFSVSQWLADYIIQHPLLLDGLLDSRQLYQAPRREQMAQQLSTRVHELLQAEPDDQERQLDGLRHFKHEQILHVAAMDVTEALPLMRVSDQLTWLAEVILDEVYRQAWQDVTQKWGKPSAHLAGQLITPGMGIIAYGKLGGIELGYGSDLDIVFIHNSVGEEQVTQGERSVDNAVFFARLAQRIMHSVGTTTVAGVLYEVDLRLRPDGQAGVLVPSITGFAQYQREKAWTWEYQALVRARWVAGDPALAEMFAQIRREILMRRRDVAILRVEVQEMRERMRQSLSKSKNDEFDLKQDRGGIADIEFMVQYGVLAWSADHPELTRFPDNIRLLESFAEAGLIETADAAFLTDAYRELRGHIHRQALQGENAVLAELSPALRAVVEGVARYWQRWMET
ncbi:MAG: bifunctional [glutamate--ammonia ligase]-adenylyl-L-tyrosine phosphorylase/[glutamate--ammonia-ligase] adenylyltransferase [Gammaproteobacteria bacterium]|nr:bifunctional [glutamate--ammonia ligase]-adenylyl-L-tyrosine phosphorylase/[glutamate--ammonia-ligase] adenylyltransferase [Gammaproteobacteria bacterium]